MFLNWTELRTELRAAIGRFSSLQPEVMHGIDTV